MKKMRTVAILVFITVVTLSQRYCCGTTFPLHRAYPPAHKEDIQIVMARDRARVLTRRIISNFSLNGSDDLYVAGLYYTKIMLGTPPQKFFVEIDTGSDLLWLSCTPCRGCPRVTTFGFNLSFFDPSKSSTSTSFSHWDFSVDYLDGSATTGYMVIDQLHLASLTPNSSSSELVQFGCSTTRSGRISQESGAVDGIFGFGQGKESVISQLSSQGITPRVFSHCLKGGDIGGGFLVIGETVHPQMIHSPLIRRQSHYSLGLVSIDVNGQLLPIDSKLTTNGVQGIVVDSGTTFTYLLKEDYLSFVSAIDRSVSRFARSQQVEEHLCYIETTSQGIEFPPVTLRFDGGASMVLRPQDYLLRYILPNDTTRWCMGFQMADDLGFPILGELSLKDKIIEYDLQQQQISWTGYDCWSSYQVNASYGFSSNSPQFKLSRTKTISILLLTVIISTLLA